MLRPKVSQAEIVVLIHIDLQSDNNISISQNGYHDSILTLKNECTLYCLDCSPCDFEWKLIIIHGFKLNVKKVSIIKLI